MTILPRQASARSAAAFEAPPTGSMTIFAPWPPVSMRTALRTVSRISPFPRSIVASAPAPPARTAFSPPATRTGPASPRDARILLAEHAADHCLCAECFRDLHAGNADAAGCAEHKDNIVFLHTCPFDETKMRGLICQTKRSTLGEGDTWRHEEHVDCPDA